MKLVFFCTFLNENLMADGRSTSPLAKHDQLPSSDDPRRIQRRRKPAEFA